MLRLNQYEKVGPFWCDFYHLTTPYTFFMDGQHNTIETYEMFIRKNPFKSGYTIVAGLGPMIDWIRTWKFTDEHIDFLRTYKTKNGEQKFSEDFLKMLKDTPINVDIEAMPEGELIFPNEPFIRITGPSWQCGLMESAFLNCINASSLIATKASRIVRSACIDGKQRPVAEFGLRRANDFMGLIPSRASIIGGIRRTSNVASNFIDGTEGTGTHPHFYIMHYDDEYEAFKKWVIYNKNDSLSILIDTYDTLKATDKVIQVQKETGIKIDSIRIDSGDLAELSKKVRKKFDENGCENIKICLSNDLDEYKIIDLIQNKKGQVDLFGIGTNLVAPSDSSTIGGVYKLKRTNGRDVIKVSDEYAKTTIPGATEIIRLLDNDNTFLSDIVLPYRNNFDKEGVLKEDIVSINIKNFEKKVFKKGQKYYKPMINVVKSGKIINEVDKTNIYEIYDFTKKNLSLLKDSYKELINPETYFVGVEENLFNERDSMIKKYKENYKNA